MGEKNSVLWSRKYGSATARLKDYCKSVKELNAVSLSLALSHSLSMVLRCSLSIRLLIGVPCMTYSHLPFGSERCSIWNR